MEPQTLPQARARLRDPAFRETLRITARQFGTTKATRHYRGALLWRGEALWQGPPRLSAGIGPTAALQQARDDARGMRETGEERA